MDHEIIRHLETLELSRPVTKAEIIAAHRKQAMLWHPDRHSGATKPEAEIRMKRINVAKDRLLELWKSHPIAGEEFVANSGRRQNPQRNPWATRDAPATPASPSAAKSGSWVDESSDPQATPPESTLNPRLARTRDLAVFWLGIVGIGVSVIGIVALTSYSIGGSAIGSVSLPLGVLSLLLAVKLKRYERMDDDADERKMYWAGWTMSLLSTVSGSIFLLAFAIAGGAVIGVVAETVICISAFSALYPDLALIALRRTVVVFLWGVFAIIFVGWGVVILTVYALTGTTQHNDEESPPSGFGGFVDSMARWLEDLW